MAEKRRTGSNPLDSLLKQIPDYVGKAAREEHSKEEQSKTEPETIAQPESQAKTKPIAETVAKPKPKSQSETITQTFTQTFANDLKTRAAENEVKPRFEEAQKRQTYWLDKDTIARIAELAEKAKCNKYQVVSAGVQMLYEYVFAEQESAVPEAAGPETGAE